MRFNLKDTIYLFTVWITLFIIGIDLFVISPLLPFISTEFNITTAVAGWIVTVFYFNFVRSISLRTVQVREFPVFLYQYLKNLYHL